MARDKALEAYIEVIRKDTERSLLGDSEFLELRRKADIEAREESNSFYYRNMVFLRVEQAMPSISQMLDSFNRRHPKNKIPTKDSFDDWMSDEAKQIPSAIRSFDENRAWEVFGWIFFTTIGCLILATAIYQAITAK